MYNLPDSISLAAFELAAAGNNSIGEAMQELAAAIHTHTISASESVKPYGIAKDVKAALEGVPVELHNVRGYVSEWDDDRDFSDADCYFVTFDVTVPSEWSKSDTHDRLLETLGEYFDEGCSCMHDCCGCRFMSSLICNVEEMPEWARTEDNRYAVRLNVNYGLNY